jgi:ABC-type polar amino acid transport system ATPase subunit
MELQRQMLEHAAWRWRTTNMLDEEALTHDLSGGLQQSVTMFRAIGMVSRMPFFQGMDSECVRTVVSCLRTQHFIGSDIVARQSDICTGCYYLFAGSVALVTHQECVLLL